MALSIKDEALDRDVRELARATGQNLTGAVRLAVRNELARHRSVPPEEVERRLRLIRQIQDEVARLPVLDPRTADEIVGYDEDGLPT